MERILKLEKSRQINVFLKFPIYVLFYYCIILLLCISVYVHCAFCGSLMRELKGNWKNAEARVHYYC